MTKRQPVSHVSAVTLSLLCPWGLSRYPYSALRLRENGLKMSSLREGTDYNLVIDFSPETVDALRRLPREEVWERALRLIHAEETIFDLPSESIGLGAGKPVLSSRPADNPVHGTVWAHLGCVCPVDTILDTGSLFFDYVK